MKLFLVGFMGCGKSTVGRRLARTLGVEFADTDRMIEAAHGDTVAGIFARYGEEYFRRCEREAIRRLAAEAGERVVATGGGVPCGAGNMELMNASGTTLYLKMTPERLAQRLGRGRDRRPLLRGRSDEELLDYIRSTLAVREPFYARASMVIDCEGRSDDYIARHVAGYMRYMRQNGLNK